LDITIILFGWYYCAGLHLLLEAATCQPEATGNRQEAGRLATLALSGSRMAARTSPAAAGFHSN